ncbi:unnamed protein product [Pleuronectes platessa]|uniref:Uncharacterized protein n=1 Tax=Pleuronectes platessa TaxID=8262 RepID=A0A9N7Z3C4_PLEPL|nr:unnamed protein product [Pleuronectes platessa]
MEVWDGLLQAFKSRQEILREALPLKSPVIRLLTALYLGIRGRGRVWTVQTSGSSSSTVPFSHVSWRLIRCIAAHVPLSGRSSRAGGLRLTEMTHWGNKQNLLYWERSRLGTLRRLVTSVYNRYKRAKVTGPLLHPELRLHPSVEDLMTEDSLI